MRKHFQMLVIVAVVLLVPSMIFAGSAKFGVAKATSSSNSLVTVPLLIENKADLAALDIPLQFSEGVALKEVTWEGTRTEYFDLKIANIQNDQNTVVIGMLPQMSMKFKPDLAAGDMNSAPVANLVFEVLDPNVTEITLRAIELKNPGHALQYVYHNYDGAGNITGVHVEKPDFQQVTFSLSGSETGGNLPTQYALNQNYPNPFNPSTEISFALPEQSRVNLSVFNVLGQKVVTLVDQEMEAGQHTVTFDADQYGSGVYFYRMATSKYHETKKMVLLK